MINDNEHSALHAGRQLFGNYLRSISCADKLANRTAARRTEGRISQWDALALIKQGFVHAFLPDQDQERLLKTVDAALYNQLLESP